VRAWAGLGLLVAARAYRAFLLSLVALALLPGLFGCSVILVRTGSMEPTISAGDVVIAAPLSGSAPIVLGRVMVFTSPETGRTTVHRVVAKTSAGEYTTKGNANAANDPTPVPRSSFHGTGRILVPLVGLPLLWLYDRELTWLLLWGVLTVLAFVVAGRPRWPEWLTGSRSPPPPVAGTSAGSRPRRTQRGAPGRPVVALVGRVALCIAAVSVLAMVPGSRAGAASYFSGTTANAGNQWTMFVQPQGKLTGTSWTISKAGAGATGVVYGYGFTTATGATLSSVTMSVPAGSAGTPVYGTASGLPTGGVWSLAGTTLTYAFTSTYVTLATVVTLTVGGLTNTSVAGVYTAVVATSGTNTAGPGLPVDDGQSGTVTVTPALGQLVGAVWGVSKAAVGATGVAYTYGFTTVTSATLASVTMTVPTGTGGPPSLASVAGLPAGGTVALAGTTLTYTFGASYIIAGTPVTLAVSGITNTSLAGSYTAQVTTNGSSAAVPVDTGQAGPLSFGTGALVTPVWTLSNGATGATSVRYAYGFTTATGATLSSVTMTVPTGTGGTPTVLSATGVPPNGSAALSGTVLTYSFAGTYMNPGTVVTVAFGGLTNASSAGSYSTQITTKGTNTGGTALPLDTGFAGPLTLSPGTLVAPSWSISKGATSAPGTTYIYGFTTATNATLSSVTMTVPPGTSGSPARGSITGVPSNGTVALAGTVLTYSFTATQLSPATVVTIAVSGLTNTPAVGSYVTQLTTTRSSPSAPVDNGLAGPLSFGAGTMAAPLWTISNGATNATSVRYGYSFTTATGATLSTVTMTVPSGTSGTPTGSSVTGVPAGGTVVLAGTLLTYSFNPIYVNPGTAVTLTIGGMTNTSVAGSYPAELSTNGTNNQAPSLPIDTGLVGPLSVAGGTLVTPSWSTSRGTTGASGVTYTYGFTTATNATLSSVSVTVPPGTSGTPSVSSRSGLPGGGTTTLVGTVLTYSFTATHLNPATAVSIAFSGLTNTPTTGSYVTQLTTYVPSAGVPVDNGLAGPLSFGAGTLGSPTWTATSTTAGATGVTYSYTFTTASGATMTGVTMSVPAGTSGTPSGGSVSGVPTGGTWSLSGTVLAYTFAGTYLNPGTVVRLNPGGMANSATKGSYVAELTTMGTTTIDAAYPIDTGVTGTLTLR
jgi:signal peptidase I